MQSMVDLESTPWITGCKSKPNADLRLFCFPYAGGGSHIFGPWLHCAPETIQVCPVQLPGRGGRLKEQPFVRLSALVQAAVEGLLPYLDRPFAFFGHSMGAWIAFELAHALRKSCGPKPSHLFVSGCRAPQAPNPNPRTYDLPDIEFVEDLRRNFGGSIVANDSELIRLMLPTLRADFAVCQTYVYLPKPNLDCPITGFGGLQDSTVSREALEAWKYQTNSCFSLRMFPGDHFFLHTKVPEVLLAISQDLRKDL